MRKGGMTENFEGSEILKGGRDVVPRKVWAEFRVTGMVWERYVV